MRETGGAMKCTAADDGAALARRPACLVFATAHVSTPLSSHFLPAWALSTCEERDVSVGQQKALERKTRLLHYCLLLHQEGAHDAVAHSSAAQHAAVCAVDGLVGL
jgi:hypothetical protein